MFEICKKKKTSKKTDGKSEGKLGIIHRGLYSEGLLLGKAQVSDQDGLMEGGLGSRQGHN